MFIRILTVLLAITAFGGGCSAFLQEGDLHPVREKMKLGYFYGPKGDPTKAEAHPLIENKPAYDESLLLEKQPVVPPGDLKPADWGFEREAILIRVKAANDLNIYAEKSNALLLGIYQLNDPNIFNANVSTFEGLSNMLSCEGYDQALGVVAVKKVMILPGEVKHIVMDRASTSQYVGVIAAYYELKPGKVAKLIRVPVEMKKKTWLNPFSYRIPRPMKIKIWLELGDLQIDNMTTQVE